MNLPLARFRCRNGHEFEAPMLSGGYGQFVLRSPAGDLVSVDAIDDPVFSEVDALVQSLDAVSGLDDARRGGVVRAAFESALDVDSEGQPFSFSQEPPCPICGSTTMDSFEQIDPPQRVEIDLAPATYERWSSMSDTSKLDVVSKAVLDELSR